MRMAGLRPLDRRGSTEGAPRAGGAARPFATRTFQRSPYPGTCTITAQRKPQSSRAMAVAATTERFPRATSRVNG